MTSKNSLNTAATPSATNVDSASEPAGALQVRINKALPQTQCTRCGFPDCAAYASAIAQDGAAINQCPPGGAEGIRRLAAITGHPVIALNVDHGLEGPRSIAVIDETWCIGCTLCLDACPTDAIFGSNKLMHTVIEPYCTGCELCIPVCPVDCISLENVSGLQTGWAAWSATQADTARSRYDFHSSRGNQHGGYRQKSLKTTQVLATADSQGFPEQRAQTKAIQTTQPAPATHVIAATAVTAEKASHGASEAAPPDPVAAAATAAALQRRAVIDAALARSRALRQPKP